MVFGTGERTIGLCAALTLVAGLALSAAPAAHASEAPTEVSQDPATATTSGDDDAVDSEPEIVQPDYSETSSLSTTTTLPADDDDSVPEEDPASESGDPTGNGSVPPASGTPESDPTPTGSPTLEPAPTTPTDDQDDTGDDGDQGQDDETTGKETDPPPELSCEGNLVEVGGTGEGSCTVSPELQVHIPNASSGMGTVEVVGNRILYRAPQSLDQGTTDVFTVEARDSDGALANDQNGDPLRTSVQFTIYGDTGSNESTTPSPSTPGDTAAPTTPDNGANGDDESTPTTSPEPTESESTGSGGNGDDTSGETGDGTGDTPAEADTGPAEGEQTSEPSASETSIGAPDTSPSALRLPIPGAPASVREEMGSAPQSSEPNPNLTKSADEGADAGAAQGSDESDDDSDSSADGGFLAQTGPEQIAWSGSFALAAIVLGIAALRLSHRETR